MLFYELKNKGGINVLLELLTNNISQDDYLRLNNVILIISELPKKIYGFIYSHKEYNVIIVNKSLSYYKRKKTILHELAHLELCHLQMKKIGLNFKIEDLEDEADIYLNELKNAIQR